MQIVNAKAEWAVEKAVAVKEKRTMNPAHNLNEF
jgi:hypothetical protein